MDFYWILDQILIIFSMIFASFFVMIFGSIFDTFRSGVSSFFNVLILWKSLFFLRPNEGFTISPNFEKIDFLSKFQSKFYPFSHHFFIMFHDFFGIVFCIEFCMDFWWKKGPKLMPKSMPKSSKIDFGRPRGRQMST